MIPSFNIFIRLYDAQPALRLVTWCQFKPSSTVRAALHAAQHTNPFELDGEATASVQRSGAHPVQQMPPMTYVLHFEAL